MIHVPCFTTIDDAVSVQKSDGARGFTLDKRCGGYLNKRALHGLA